MQRCSSAVLLFVFFTSLAVLIAGPSRATPVIDTEPNDTLATAQSLDGFFSTTFDLSIEDAFGTNTSTFLPHVEVFSPIDPGFSSDFFSFTALAGDHLILDIDCGFASSTIPTCSSAIPIDTFITLYDPAGLAYFSSGDTIVGTDIDSIKADTGSAGIESGASSSVDSYIDLLYVSGAIPVSGIWTVEVGAGSGPLPVPFAPASDYILNVSLTSGIAVPEPSTALLLGSGLVGMAIRRRRPASGDLR